MFVFVVEIRVREGRYSVGGGEVLKVFVVGWVFREVSLDVVYYVGGLLGDMFGVNFYGGEGKGG